MSGCQNELSMAEILHLQAFKNVTYVTVINVRWIDCLTISAMIDIDAFSYHFVPSKIINTSEPNKIPLRKPSFGI